MILLSSLRYRRPPARKAGAFPFNVPSIQTLAELEFTSAVTFFVGENGSGKSTLLEAIAAAAHLPTVGSESVDRDATLAAVRQLAKQLTLSWSRRTHDGFFMRSEDFFGFAKRLASMRREMERELEEVEREFAARSDYARGLARGPHMAGLAELRSRYGEDLDARSHGESYFKLFQSRFVPDGLYLMDEPEAPLSPMKQLALISLIKLMVEEQNAQFIIATHSPMLMALPGATIYSFDHEPIRRLAYDQVDHVTITKAFLDRPEQFLRHL
jgi:predicted ATPase